MKTQFEEIETDDCTEGIKKCVKRPPIIGEKDLPGLEVRNRTLDGSADRTDLVIVFVFTRVEFTILWLLGRRDVARPLKSLVCDNRSGKVENLLHLAFQLLHVMVTSGEPGPRRRYAPRAHRVVRHPVRRYGGSAAAPPSVEGLLSTSFLPAWRAVAFQARRAEIRTLKTIRWRSAKPALESL